MKDMLGNEIRAGDTVAWLENEFCYGSNRIEKVLGFDKSDNTIETDNGYINADEVVVCKTTPKTHEFIGETMIDGAYLVCKENGGFNPGDTIKIINLSNEEVLRLVAEAREEAAHKEPDKPTPLRKGDRVAFLGYSNDDEATRAMIVKAVVLSADNCRLCNLVEIRTMEDSPRTVRIGRESLLVLK